MRYAIVFDGGSRGNPGLGYGSFRIREGDGDWAPAHRLEFGDGVTNNEAEYRALIAAFEEVAAACDDAARATVDVYGDSQLVLRQLKGEWKVRAANLRPLHDAARRGAAAFGTVRYRWQGRDASVELLGH